MKHTPTATMLATLCERVYGRSGEGLSRWRGRLADDLKAMSVDPVWIFDFADIQGFVGNHYGHRIVCIRGTDSPAEQLTNLFARKVTVGLGAAKVHHSFAQDADNLLARLSDRVDFCDDRVDWMCGHSRGGAVAQIVAARVSYVKRLTHANAQPTHCVTFESPRVGNTDFAAYMRKYIPHVRFQRAGDIVPLVPLWPFFHHDRDPAFFDQDGLLRPDVGWLTRVMSWPLAVLSHMGVPGCAGIELHSMSQLARMIEREEAELGVAGNLLVDLLDR